jgi:hypothetical protein
MSKPMFRSQSEVITAAPPGWRVIWAHQIGADSNKIGADQTEWVWEYAEDEVVAFKIENGRGRPIGVEHSSLIHDKYLLLTPHGLFIDQEGLDYLSVERWKKEAVEADESENHLPVPDRFAAAAE